MRFISSSETHGTSSEGWKTKNTKQSLNGDETKEWSWNSFPDTWHSGPGWLYKKQPGEMNPKNPSYETWSGLSDHTDGHVQVHKKEERSGFNDVEKEKLEKMEI